MRHLEATAQLAAPPSTVFAYLDDQTRLAGHMGKPSLMMGGGRMNYEFDDLAGRAVGSHIRMSGSAFGLHLSVDEVVKERTPPQLKVWRTVGSPKLVVVKSYEMGFELSQVDGGTALKVWIDYDLPSHGLGRVLGFLGAAYARWCVDQMVQDAARTFGHLATSASDPAEGSFFLRFFYRDWHPTFLGRTLSHVIAWICGLGLTPRSLLTLQVKGRSSGRLRSTIHVVVNHEGKRYLVSMLGSNSEWVKNVHAAGGSAFIKRGRREPVTLIEILPDERAPILKAWCKVATSGRRHLPVRSDAPISDYEAIAPTFPVFRIESRAIHASVPLVSDVPPIAAADPT